jgi:mitochondrial protein import protein ZIM17
MKERGQLVKKGTLSEDGDVEFWEDGTQTERRKDRKEKEQAQIGQVSKTEVEEGFD